VKIKLRRILSYRILPYNKKDKLLDFFDDVKIRFFNFWDFKYRKIRKQKKAMLKEGEMEKIPVKKAVSKDVKEMGYKPNFSSQSMKYVKTKGGAVIVTPESMRSIRKVYEDAELVEARIKSHQQLIDDYDKYEPCKK